MFEDATLSFLTKYTMKYHRLPIEKRPVLFLEIAEKNEQDPIVFGPTYIPLSNRQADEMTKTISKSKGKYLLIDPPKLDDLISMAQFEAKHSDDSVFKGMDESEVSETVTNRFNQIRPKIREIFEEKEDYDLYVKKTLSSVDSLYSILENFSVYDIPVKANRFIGAFVNAGVEIPYADSSDDFYLGFLSPFLAHKVAEKAKKKEIAKLESAGLDYQIAENLVRYGLLEHPFDYDDPILVKNWEFYKNPPQGGKVTATHILQKHDRPVIFPRHSEFIFHTQTINQLVVTLKDDLIYISSLVNGYLYEMLVVDHKQKIVFVFQVTSLRGNKHECDYNTIKIVMENMKIIECQYTLCYVHCSDASSKSESAVIPTNNHNLTNAETNIIKKHLKILIARVPFYRNKVIYPIK